MSVHLCPIANPVLKRVQWLYPLHWETSSGAGDNWPPTTNRGTRARNNKAYYIVTHYSIDINYKWEHFKAQKFSLFTCCCFSTHFPLNWLLLFLLLSRARCQLTASASVAPWLSPFYDVLRKLSDLMSQAFSSQYMLSRSCPTWFCVERLSFGLLWHTVVYCSLTIHSCLHVILRTLLLGDLPDGLWTPSDGLHVFAEARHCWQFCLSHRGSITG